MDYKEVVSFISEEMQFYSMTDFCNHAKWIKSMYEHLSYEGKQIYKYYVFSKRYITYPNCVLIWEIINGERLLPEPDIESSILNNFCV